MQEADIMYTEFGTKLFTQSAFWGVGNLVLNRAYYDTTMFEQLLKRFVGETPLIKTNRDANCPKVRIEKVFCYTCITVNFATHIRVLRKYISV